MSASDSALPIIRPITDLRTQLNDVCSQAAETQEPIVLTKNGVASFVLMDARTYDESQQQNRYLLALREAELEMKYNPDSLSAEESNAKMSEIFRMWGIDYA